jgi:hypothetical protein
MCQMVAINVTFCQDLLVLLQNTRLNMVKKRKDVPWIEGEDVLKRD